MNAKHLSEELIEAQVPHWNVLIEDESGNLYEIHSMRFKTTSDQGGLVILSALLPPKKDATS